MEIELRMQMMKDTKELKRIAESKRREPLAESDSWGWLHFMVPFRKNTWCYAPREDVEKVGDYFRIRDIGIEIHRKECHFLI